MTALSKLDPEEQNDPASGGIVRCPRCRGRLHPSSQEPHRHVCSQCGKEFRALLHFVEVESLRPLELPPSEDDAQRRKTSE